MSRWFRHYAGMMRDDKLVRVAIRSKQTIERVAWIWGAILESAAEIDDGGRYDVDAAEVSYFLRADQTDVDAVLAALADAGRVADGCVVKWGNRQFSSDRSKERVAAHRERKRATGGDSNDLSEAGNADVTLQGCHGNSPETDTEEEEEKTPLKPPRKRRGEGKHVLPDDWQFPACEDLTPAAQDCAKQWQAGSYRAQSEAFENHFRSARTKHSDWRLAASNWVIRAHSQVMRDQKFGNAPAAAPARRPMNADELRNAIRFAEDHGDHERAAECKAQLQRLRSEARPPPPQIQNILSKTAAGLRASNG